MEAVMLLPAGNRDGPYQHCRVQLRIEGQIGSERKRRQYNAFVDHDDTSARKSGSRDLYRTPQKIAQGEGQTRLGAKMQRGGDRWGWHSHDLGAGCADRKHEMVRILAFVRKDDPKRPLVGSRLSTFCCRPMIPYRRMLLRHTVRRQKIHQDPEPS
jgi:hypothetical protein